MLPATPQLQLETLFVLDSHGRIVSTREPRPSPGPAFILVRGVAECAWAVHATVPEGAADRLHDLARREGPPADWGQPPAHAGEYLAVVGGRVASGPAFEFPERVGVPGGVVPVHDEAPLGRHFTGWVAGEIEGGASPVLAVCEGGSPVSVCFCARRGAPAAEAGLETAAGFRRRGHAVRVAAAWAAAVRASGRTPLYSTEWDNVGSLGVARKLGLSIYATDWSIG